MLLEVITELSSNSEPYLLNVNHFNSYPMNLRSTLVLEGNWSFVDGNFDKFMNDDGISINKQKHLVINHKRFFTSNVSECRYCGTVVEDENSLCYNCMNNNDKMYHLVREGTARYKYDKGDTEVKVRCADCWHLGNRNRTKFGSNKRGCYATGKWSYLGVETVFKLFPCDLFEKRITMNDLFPSKEMT